MKTKCKMKNLKLAVAVVVSVAGGTAWAQSDVNQDLRALKEQVRVLTEKIQSIEERTGSSSNLPPTLARGGTNSLPRIEIGSEGFVIASADGQHVLKLRGMIQADSRWYFGNRTALDTFLLRRVRPIFEGTLFRDLDFRFLPDFGLGQTVIQDAWLNYRFTPALQLQAGKYKTPLGLEFIQHDAFSLFTERALPTDLVPGRDVGVTLHGDLARGAVSYSLGVFNGVADGASGDLERTDSDKDMVGRVFVQPFKSGETKALKGLGLGVAGSYGVARGTNSLASYKTDGQQTFFAYRNSATGGANVTADGEHLRFSPQGYYYYGPIGLLGEYVVSSQQVRRTDGAFSKKTARLENTAWQVAASVVLTGEDASYTGMVPRRNFDWSAGGWGALELAARHSELSIDSQAFPLFAAPATSASAARAWAVGLNWYLNPNLKICTDFFHTDFSGGKTGATTKQAENAVFTRMQVNF